MNKMIIVTLMLMSLLNANTFEKKGSMVYDSKAELSWELNPRSKKMNWKEAVSHCKSLELRLPNLYELKSLVDYATYKPAIRTELINIKIDDWYWTSSEDVDPSNKKSSAWVVHFVNGLDYCYSRTSTSYVLCVSGQ